MIRDATFSDAVRDRNFRIMREDEAGHIGLGLRVATVMSTPRSKPEPTSAEFTIR